MNYIFYHVEFTVFFVNKKTFSDFFCFSLEEISKELSFEDMKSKFSKLLEDIDQNIIKETESYLKTKDLEKEKGYKIERIQKFPFKLN